MNEHRERIHYSAVHTALEQYLERDIPGSLTRAQYPAEGADKGDIEFVFTEPKSTVREEPKDGDNQ